ncbi:MAG: class I SAM-dependent methyltransferase [Cyanobacteria bacterium SID2]|nr:class I SAM-dependent methyltransferase [Cyanobacteria bacterium SID2]MBP0004363.1 class I SAM-dependent methyltransferase [Cyanobacteria bacterium SBC]
MDATQIANGLTDRFFDRFLSGLTQRGNLAFSFTIHDRNGSQQIIGNFEPIFDLYIKTEAGRKALLSLNQLTITEAYMNGDIEAEGDIIQAMSLGDLMSDFNPVLKFWHWFQPLLFGREKCNPQWIAKHYDSENIQLIAIDTQYHVYTPGIYESDDESLEIGAERKLEFAVQSLNIKPNDRVLEVGSGWGGFLRYAASRDAKVTGITLSQHQAQYVKKLIEENYLDAEVRYQDFFTFEPDCQYDAISMMGVIEDLSDYHLVMEKLPSLLKPGGRVYLDFAADNHTKGTHSFVTKYVWPGAFRHVDMPEFMAAVRKSPFEIVAIYNDRHNYYLWAKGIYERWMQRKAEAIEQSDERFWRLFRILAAGTANAMSKPTYSVTAYRIVLEYPADYRG